MILGDGMEKLEIHIRNWLVIGFLGLLLFVSILLVSDLISNIFKLNPSWDVLAFSGAIIGGGLTLVGVRYTLKEQARKDFIQAAPMKIRYIDKTIKKMSELRNKVYEDKVSEINKLYEEILEVTAHIDSDTYRYAYQFGHEIELYLLMIQIQKDFGENFFLPDENYQTRKMDLLSSITQFNVNFLNRKHENYIKKL
jgi:hypothetical protein